MAQAQTDAGGVKHDDGKLRLDLIPPEAIRALGEIFTHGCQKYGDRNWEQGIAPDRLYAACQRHLLAHRLGEATDPESGLPHLAHALCNLAMWLTLEQRRK
jgi:hypothetical protein